MTTTAQTPEPVYWSTLQKVAFRFFFIFFILYVFFNPNGVIPFVDKVFEFYIEPFHKLVPWLAAHVLHIAKPVTIVPTGSGDTTYDYLIMLLIATLTLIGTVIWSVTDRNTRNYNKLFYWLTVVVRYYVGITMISYGFYKVIKLQFPSPGLGRLVEPFGNSSPMGLAWTYMGYSVGFNYFTGLAEISVGLLLFFRKTSTLGAIVGLVVAGNIMAINYCFDVPVKLLSTTLVVMSMFLLLRDFRRLVNFFFLNKDALPSNLSPHRFAKSWKNITLTVLKYVLILYTIFGDMYGAVKLSGQYGDKAPKPPLYGIYSVKTFVRNRDTLPPLTTDTIRWSKLIVPASGGAQILLMSDSTKRYAFKPDTAKHTITIHTNADTVHKYQFTYTLTRQGVLTMKGKWKEDSLHLVMQRFDLKKFRLMQGKFRWVNEFPYNK